MNSYRYYDIVNLSICFLLYFLSPAAFSSILLPPSLSLTFYLSLSLSLSLCLSLFFSPFLSLSLSLFFLSLFFSLSLTLSLTLSLSLHLCGFLFLTSTYRQVTLCLFHLSSSNYRFLDTTEWKVFYHLYHARAAAGIDTITLVRVEQVAPFPFDLLGPAILRFPQGE